MKLSCFDTNLKGRVKYFSHCGLNSDQSKTSLRSDNRVPNKVFFSTSTKMTQSNANMQMEFWL